jgi:hypothetical protein
VTPRAVWTPLAESELDEVLFQIAVRSRRPETGIKNYFEIRSLVDEYAREDAPRHRHPVSPDDWFYCRHKRWLIFYRLLKRHRSDASHRWQPRFAATISERLIIPVSGILPKIISEQNYTHSTCQTSPLRYHRAIMDARTLPARPCRGISYKGRLTCPRCSMTVRR